MKKITQGEIPTLHAVCISLVNALMQYSCRICFEVTPRIQNIF